MLLEDVIRKIIDDGMVVTIGSKEDDGSIPVEITDGPSHFLYAADSFDDLASTLIVADYCRLDSHK